MKLSEFKNLNKFLHNLFNFFKKNMIVSSLEKINDYDENGLLMVNEFTNSEKQLISEYEIMSFEEFSFFLDNNREQKRVNWIVLD